MSVIGWAIVMTAILTRLTTWVLAYLLFRGLVQTVPAALEPTFANVYELRHGTVNKPAPKSSGW